MPTEKRTQLIVRMDARELEGLRRRADWYKKSLADLVRDCLREGLPQVLAAYERERERREAEVERFAAWEGPDADADARAFAGPEALRPPVEEDPEGAAAG